MKIAKAMRYGGELVDAKDCDYSDFKGLIPLCPSCSEPVFLRKSCDRVSKLGKEFVIPQHWAHFDSTSEEQRAACEARVSGYTDADKQRIQSQARGQRLKLIQRWFWGVFKRNSWTYKNFKDCDGERVLANIQKDLKVFDVWDDKGLMESFNSIKAWCMREAKDGIGSHGTPMSAHDMRKRRGDVFIYGPGEKDHAWYIPQGMPQLLAAEIIDFLMAPTSAFLVESMFEVFAVVDILNPRRGFPQSDFTRICHEVISFPWASEFARLEAEEARPNPAP